MWLLPLLLLATAVVLSIPLSAYFAWLMDGKYKAPRVLRWFESLLDTGPQNWKQYTLALVVYLLYGLGYFTVISALVGVVIAHVKIDDADPALRSHYQFQIRTFWIGLLYFTIGLPLCMVLIGFPILIWWFVWSVIRVVKGLILLNENKPVANPKSWMFG